MCGNLRRTAGAFLAALMLLASFPAYAVEEREEDGVSAEAVEEALPGEESREELEEPEDPWEEPETPEEGVEEVPPETPEEETAEEAGPPVTLSVEPGSGTWGNLSWTLDSEGTLTISGTGKMGSNSPWRWNSDIKRVVIESGVTSIGDEAFYLCTGLSSITIPDSVVSIGEEAFCNCTSLTGITIPDSVVSIGDEAFYGCTGLTGITIPDSVTSIGDEVFYGCTSLASVIIPKNVTSIAYRMFSGCTSLTSVTIPGGVSSIGDGAFSGCTSLTSVTIPEGVSSIGSSAFSGCEGLTSVTIPESVTEIGRSTFSGCTKLKTAGPIGSGSGYQFGWTSAIPEDAFYGCTNLTSVTIPEGVSSIGSSAFSGCEGLTSITVPASVTEIGYYTFSGCTGLTSAGPIDDGNDYDYRFGWTTAIPDCAFKGCSGLTSITVPASVTEIGYYTFSGCTGLETAGPIGSGSGYEFGWTVAIPEDAFKGCSGLTSVTLPENLASICRSAFSGCEKLKSITIPASVEKIESGAFSGCTSLTSAGPIGGNYGYQFGWTAAIPENAFYNCSSLTSVTIPGGVTSIGSYAFKGCTGLTGITIPDSVTSIGSSAFSGCTGLTDIAIPDGVTLIDWGTFSDCSGLTGISIPENVTSIRGKAFSGCTGLTRIAIPRNVTSITSDAFSGCSSLTAIEVSGENMTYSSVNGVLLNNKKSALAAYPIGRQGGYDIPEGVTSISGGAFAGCTGLTRITIPESVTSIGDRAFSGCTGLTSAGPIGGGYDYQFGWTTAIPSNAFADCTGLTSIIIPESITSVGSSALSGCSGLTSAGPIGSGCDYQFGWTTAIPDHAFQNCYSLTTVTLPESVTSIGSSAFSGCGNLTSLTIPKGVTSIGSWAFYMSGLTDIDIPKGVISIGDLAFHACSYLTSVVIPEGVSSIGSDAFGSCRNLTSVTIPDSVTSIGDDAFRYCSPNLCIYCYPGSPAESYAVENNLHYALLRRGDGDVSTWLSVNAPSGVTAGETFLVRTGYSALNAARLELGLPEGAVLSSLWLDGKELSAGDYTRSGNSLAVPVSGLAEAPAHTLYLYCTASAGSHRISGRLVMVNGETHSLGAAAVRVSDAWLSVPERVGYPEGILATGKTAPGRTVTLFVDGVQAGAATSNSAGSWRIPFNLTEAGSHTVYAEIGLPEGGTVPTAEAHVEYRPCAVYPLKLTMYNTGDHGAQATEFTFTDPDAANLIRYYRIWPSRFPSFTFKAEFFGDPSTLSGVSVVTVNGAGVETVIPAAYNGNSHAWVASYEYTEFENAPVWVYVSCPGVCSGRLSAVPIMDPSGYVYEAVPSNRLAGVQAEIYYQKDGGEVLWNAASFDQANPQTTGPDGSYYWDVPAGHWKVRFTKDGYGSAETDWLPVPPPQVGINVPMVSTAKPEVRCAAVYGDHAEVTFSQYMKIDSVAISLNGTPAAAEPLDAEYDAEKKIQYATRFKAVAVESLSGSAQLSVAAEAANYAGTTLADTYAESLPVEVCPERITAPERVDMEMSGRQDIRVTLESDNSGISGRKLTVENLTPAIISVDKTSVTTGEGGTVEIPVTSLLPGTGILRISEPASGLSADVTVQVEAAVKPEVSIKASLAGRVLTYSVQNVDEQANAKLLAAGYDGGRMSGAVILQGMSGTWTLPDAPSGSYVLFLLEAGTWRPLCPRVTVPKQ